MSADDPQSTIANTLFPPPPPYFKAFTTENIERYKALKKLAGQDTLPSETTSAESSTGNHTSSEARSQELERLEDELGKPRVDWVEEDGRWMCFGELLSTTPKIPTPADIGLPPFTDSSQPPQETMPPLLHSFLYTMMLLLDALTNTARIPGELEEKGWAHEGDQYIQHLTNLAATMMVEANQVRSVQAEATLVLLMEKQLAERKAQTAALKSKCEHIATSLRELRRPR